MGVNYVGDYAQFLFVYYIKTVCAISIILKRFLFVKG